MRAIWKSSLSLLTALTITSIAVPAKAAAQCGDLNLVTSLDLRTLPSGRPAIDGMIGDTPETFLIDTGGVISMVTSRTVRELKLTTTTNRRMALTGVNGASTQTVAQLPSITIGRYRQQGVYFFVMRVRDDPSDTTQPEFAGLIAPDFLQNFDADFDFAQKKLNLISPDHCAGKVQYWSAPSIAIVSMTMDSAGHIKFPMTLDGRRVNALLDTGASTTTLNLTVARQQFDVDPNAPDVEKVGELSGGYSASVYRRRFKTLAFEGVVINNPMIDLLPDLMGGQVAAAPRTGSIIREDRGIPEVILGMTTLNQLHLYIAYKERKVYITAAGTAPGPTSPAQ